jgi:colicin import membrane protein
LAAQLGLESVEELEAVIDSMDGIADDGSMLEQENLAREARIRSAYMDWCKEFGKKSDESRFPTFSQNFLDMEEFAKESGKEMQLNEYADFSEAEYGQLARDATAAEKKAAVAEQTAEKKAAEAEQTAEKKAAADAAKVKAAAAKVEADAAAKVAAEAKAKADAVTAENRKKEAVKQAKIAAEKGKLNSTERCTARD